MPRPRPNQAGLSLIELLVAIAIVAAMYGAIVLSVDTVGGARTVEREGERLRSLVMLGCERAMLSGRDVGLHFSQSRYAFSTQTPRGWRLEADVGDLRARALPKGVTLYVERDGAALELGESFTEAPQVACFASGELTPFVASVEAGASVQPYRIEAGIDGTVDGRPAEGPLP